MAKHIRLDYHLENNPKNDTRALLVNPDNATFTITEDYEILVTLTNGEQYLIEETYEDIQRILNI